jgi:hypothetical protein
MNKEECIHTAEIKENDPFYLFLLVVLSKNEMARINRKIYDVSLVFRK